MKKPLSSVSAFSLVEMIIYTGILAVVAGLFVGILSNVLRINVQESSGNEITSQLNSSMNLISKLVRESSNVEIDVATTTSILKLRMKDSQKDPTCVYISNGILKLAQGPDSINPSNCSLDPSKISDITTSKVVANSVIFKKFTFYPGHDQVAIDLQISYNSDNPQAKISRILHTAVSRVSAANFDSNLLPGSDNIFQIGYPTNQRWKDLYISNSINDTVYFSGTNIGIGTNSPTAKLHIGGTAGTDGIRFPDGTMQTTASGSLVGEIKIYSSSTAPAGWLLCNGSAVSRITYSALFSVIGVAYGVGDGSITFNLPDLRGRTAIGVGQGTGLTNRSLGQSIGEEYHTLSVSEMPSHNHGVNDPGHRHYSVDGNPIVTQVGYESWGLQSGDFKVINNNPSYVTLNYTGISIQNNGGGSAHNVTQPSLVVNYIIKY
ncbi:MAG: tail fiber protein [Patescibacteria group bacterium]|nr:tail fiber protein [Patescibacteria group bacterium]